MRDSGGTVVAALGVSGPESRVDPVFDEVRAAVLRAATDLSRALGAGAAGRPGARAGPPPTEPRRRVSPVHPPCSRERSVVNYLDYLTSNSQQILFLTQAHFLVVLIAVGVGSAISIVLGLAVSTGEPNPNRFSLDWFATGIREGGLVFTAALLTVPSLALYALFLPFTGLGVATAVIVLTLYSLYTVLRNTVAGLTTVDRAILESARGLGYSRLRRLLTIQLPLAWPVILNGIRVTTLISISIAVVGAVVQGPGLGTLLINGISRIGASNSFYQVLTGTLFCLVVAAVFEIFFAIVQRLTIPRGIRV